ncbi:MFS transporter [Corynebacterium amycolatum]|uniref:MFS transporter n=1 Tax=Corynebacterium amycolatum TaxID=43765 RepID=UPI0011F07053|nr:MFS transporter [Corynebacterium amycolatum]KAA0881416.1 MFS transporter [Corynebacterium amycolatum]
MTSTDHTAYTGANPPTPVTHRWAFLAIISAGLLLIGIDNSVLYTALPVLREQLHTTELEGLWIINAYPLVISALLLGTGTLGDRIGHRKMFLVGLTIFGFSSLAAAFAPHAWALVIARGCLGLGAATMMPATLALLRETFRHPRELATAIGIWSATATLGAAAGPVVGGFLLEHFWWGSIFLINIPVVFFAIIGTLIFAPPNQPNPAKRWDFLTSLYAMLAMLGLVSLIKELAGHRSSTVIVAAIACGLVGAVLFQRRQARLTEPLIDFSVFRSRMFSGGVLAAALAMFVLAGAELMTTQRFQISVGYTPLDAGLLVATAALASLPVGVIGGMVLHRVGFRTLITGGFLLNAIGLAGMYYGVSSGNFPLMIAGLILLGAGAGSVMSVSSTAIIGSAPRSKAGMAAAMESVSYEFGTLITVAITGSLLPMFYALFTPVDASISLTDALHTPALNDGARAGLDSSYLAILIILAVVAVIAAIATAVAFRGNPKETEYAHE